MAEVSDELYGALKLYQSITSIDPKHVDDRFRKEDIRSFSKLEAWLSDGRENQLCGKENERARMVWHWLTEIDRDYKSVRRLLKRLGETEEEYKGIREELFAVPGGATSEAIGTIFQDYVKEFVFDCTDLSDFALHRIYHMWELTGQLMWSFYKLGGKWRDARFPEIRGLVIDKTLDDFFTYAGVTLSRENKAYVMGVLQKMKEIRNRVSHGSSGISVTEAMELEEEEKGSVVIWDHNTGESSELEAFSARTWVEYARMSYVHFVIGFNMLLGNMDTRLRNSGDDSKRDDVSDSHLLDNTDMEKLSIEQWLDSEEMRRAMELEGPYVDGTVEDEIMSSYEMNTDDIEFD
ncbi:hypothetical protein HY500_01075 [Candidatus Woesearchaeota archaeon]|nr:hypothetical protein [Candidatus Woesearchaeota archaeon]